MSSKISGNKLIEIEVFKVLIKSVHVRLNVIVNHLVELGFSKGDVYNVIRYKLTAPIPHLTKKEVWSEPMVILEEHKDLDGSLFKLVSLREEWFDVDEKDVIQYFSTGDLDDYYSVW